VSGLQITLSIIFALSLAAGQVLFKKTADTWSAAGTGIMGIVSPWLFAALALYGAATLLWIYILRSAPLSQAYVFSLLGSAIVPVAGFVIFKEPLSLRYAIGASLVLVGVYLCATIPAKA